MVKCTNCNRPIPDGAKFCGHCGKLTGFQPNQEQKPPFTQYQVQAHEQNGQQSAVADAKTVPAKPNCDLSVAGFILSLFSPYLCLISFIISAVALAKKQVRRKLALAGLIISLIEMVLIGVGVYVVLFVLPAKGIDITQYIPWFNQAE